VGTGLRPVQGGQSPIIGANLSGLGLKWRANFPEARFWGVCSVPHALAARNSRQARAKIRLRSP